MCINLENSSSSYKKYALLFRIIFKVIFLICSIEIWNFSDNSINEILFPFAMHSFLISVSRKDFVINSFESLVKTKSTSPDKFKYETSSIQLFSEKLKKNNMHEKI